MNFLEIIVGILIIVGIGYGVFRLWVNSQKGRCK